MALRVVVTLWLIAGVAGADALTLRDGRVVQGTYLGGDARQVRMTVGQKVETFDLSAVVKIEFVAPLTGTADPAPASPAAAVIALEAKPAEPTPAAAVIALGAKPADLAPAAAVIALEAKPAEPAPAVPQPAANAAGTLNGLAALIAVVAASPNVEKAPEIPANPFTSLPGGASKTPEPKPQQPNKP